MDDKYIINIHSMVDLITNSSTELFIIDTDKTVEFITEILQSAIDLHNKASDTNYKFDDIFEDPYFGSTVEALEGWEDIYSSNVDNGLILSGADDNSIPYWMQEFIENTFDSRRYHLG